MHIYRNLISKCKYKYKKFIDLFRSARSDIRTNDYSMADM